MYCYSRKEQLHDFINCTGVEGKKTTTFYVIEYEISFVESSYHTMQQWKL